MAKPVKGRLREALKHQNNQNKTGCQQATSLIKKGKTKQIHVDQSQIPALLRENEKWSDVYKRVPASHPWRPPASPHNLIQEEHAFDHWRVRNVLADLFDLCPTAKAATKADAHEIENTIRGLGLQKKRAKIIKKFSAAYLGKEWTHVTQLPGVNRYAADAYAILCAGKANQVVPKDHMLVHYWRFVTGMAEV